MKKTITDEHLKKLTIPQIARSFSLSAWGLFFAFLIGVFWLGYGFRGLQVPNSKQEISLGRLNSDQLFLLKEIYEYQKSNRLNKVVINRNGFIFDDTKKQDTSINLALKVLGVRANQDSFERLLYSIPVGFLDRFPEARFDSPYVVNVTEEASKILGKE